MITAFYCPKNSQQAKAFNYNESMFHKTGNINYDDSGMSFYCPTNHHTFAILCGFAMHSLSIQLSNVCSIVLNFMRVIYIWDKT